MKGRAHMNSSKELSKLPVQMAVGTGHILFSQEPGR